MAKVSLVRESGKGVKLQLLVKVSATGLPTDTNVVGLWRQDTNTAIGHSDVVKGNDATFTTEFVLDHYPAEALDVKWCVYGVKEGVVDVSTFVGCKIISIKALQTGKTSEHALEGSDAKITFAASVMVDPSKKKKKKEPKKDEGPKLSKEEEKAIKAAIKEGGKKGQDLCGMSTFGVHHFCASVDTPKDDWKLMDLCMEGMNKKVDPEADDRKGGAGDLAKILFCAGDKKLMMLAHVPDETKEMGADLAEWSKAVTDAVGGTVLSSEGNFAKSEVLADPDNNMFPLKMRDAAIAAGFAYLRTKGLVLDDDSDDEINFADQCGVDINAGAEGNDY